VNIATFLHESSRCFGARPAVTWRNETLTYRNLSDRAAKFAMWLGSANPPDGVLERGAGPGERVVLFLDNRPELLIAMFGTWHACAIVVPCNVRLTVDELAFVLTDCSASVVVTDEAHADVARKAAGSTVRVLVAGEDFDTALLDAEPGIGSMPAEVDPESTAWIFYTSGTTGRPKGAMLSHAVLNFVTVSWLADLTALDELDVTLHAAPLSHGAGFHALAATARAVHQLIPDTPSFDPPGTLEFIRTHGVTNTWMVPTQIVMLTEAAAKLDVPIAIPSLRYVVYGGAPMTPVAMTKALKQFGSIFVQLFGQGESPMMITVLRRQDHVPELLGSAGRGRAGIEVRIVDANDAPVAVDEIGELVVRGASVMSGYWNRPEATAETIVDGWLHTGDLGRMDARGIVWLLDRAKDMIISGGSNIYAVEVEQVLTTHPAVREVAVIGVPDDLWGERVVAVIVPNVGVSGLEGLDVTNLDLVNPGGVALDTAALDAHARITLAGYKVPRSYVVVESLPRNAYGKVLKRELRVTYADSTTTSSRKDSQRA
jgi:acyl-CoA synthetase (AMP-forming)/AMP-acid ligase II